MEKLKNPSFINELSRTVTERALSSSDENESKKFTYTNINPKSMSNEYTDQVENKSKKYYSSLKKTDIADGFETFLFSDQSRIVDSKTSGSSQAQMTTFKYSQLEKEPYFKKTSHKTDEKADTIKPQTSATGNSSMYATINKINTYKTTPTTLKLSSFLNMHDKSSDSNEYSFNMGDYDYDDCLGAQICNISNATSELSSDSSTGYSSLNTNPNQKHVTFSEQKEKKPLGVLV